jgi:hypothetical protein
MLTLDLSSAMQCRDKNDLIFITELVGTFPFEFPVGVVNEHKDPWTTRVTRESKK